MNEVGAVKYAETTTPKGYVCGTCGCRGVRLWRHYQTFLDHQELFCARCAEANQRKNQPDGWRSEFADGKGDTIAWLVPAVPTEDGETFWGYTSVPPDGVKWWNQLPA